MDVPVLETNRLLIREFEPGDLEAVHALLDVELGTEGALTREECHEWPTWTALGYRQLAQLHQLPYCKRAIVLKETGRLIGARGYPPVLDALGQMPSLRGDTPERPSLTSSEAGLSYALSPS